MVTSAQSHITACIATFRRPVLLRRLLDSLVSQELPDGLTFDVVVVDNDPGGTGRSPCEHFSTLLSLTYIIEPRRGIPYARNRGVALATGDMIAFIDDDERASPRWLSHLAEAKLRYSTDIVTGPVISELDPRAPNWVRKAKLHQRVRYPSGTLVSLCATNNVLVSTPLLQHEPGPFDESFGLFGAEDTDLFIRLRRKGFQMIWEDRAEVFEHVPLVRCSPRWLLQRAFRGHLEYSRIVARYDGVLGRLSCITKGIVLLALGCLALPIALLGGRARTLTAMRLGISGCGKMAGALGLRYEEYRYPG